MRMGTGTIVFLALVLVSFVGPSGAQEAALDLADGGIRFPDGSVLNSAGGSYQQVVTVAKSGAQFTTIQAAIDSIDDANSLKRYLIWVAPGTYAEQLRLKEFVSVQGSGRGLTTITHPGSSELNSGTVIMSRSSNLREVSVVSEGDGFPYAVAIYNFLTNPKLEEVSAVASHATENYGVYNLYSSPGIKRSQMYAQGGAASFAVFNSTLSSPDINEVRIDAIGDEGGVAYGVYNEESDYIRIRQSDIACTASDSCYGIYSTNSRFEMRESDVVINSANSGYGIWNEGSVATISNSSVDAWSSSTLSYAVYNAEVSTSIVRHSRLTARTHPLFGLTVQAAYTQLIGPLSKGFPDGSCIGAYDGDLKALSSDCTEVPSE